MEETLARVEEKQIKVQAAPDWSRETAVNFYRHVIELALDRS
jgi:hypothetical protein